MLMITLDLSDMPKSEICLWIDDGHMLKLMCNIKSLSRFDCGHLIFESSLFSPSFPFSLSLRDLFGSAFGCHTLSVVSIVSSLIPNRFQHFPSTTNNRKLRLPAAIFFATFLFCQTHCDPKLLPVSPFLIHSFQIEPFECWFWSLNVFVCLLPVWFLMSTI